MTRKEFERLNADHPEWIELSSDDIYHRYWMYFADRVAFARAEVHRRRLVAAMNGPLERIVCSLTKFLNRFRRNA